jgi:hypothetical protein
MAVCVGLGFLILLLIIWGSVPWTRHFWPVLPIAAFIWLERVRHRTLAQPGWWRRRWATNPAAPSGSGIQ